MTLRRAGLAELVAKWRSDRMLFRREQIYLENGQPKGLVLNPFQVADYEGLDSRQHGILIRPRAWDKTGCASDEIFTDMILGPRGQRIYSVAADLGQAQLLKEDLAAKFRRNPLTRNLIRETATTVTMKATDSRYESLPYDVPGMWGLRPSRVVLDEVGEFPPRAEAIWTALWTATAKVPGCRVLVISTPSHDPQQLLGRVLKLAKADPTRWFVSERTLDAERPTWIPDTWIEEQRKSLPAHVYDRLIRGVWVAGQGRYLTRQEVGSVFGAIPEGALAWAVAIDLAVTRDRAVIGVLRLAPDGTVVVQHLVTFTPTRDTKVDLLAVKAELLEIIQRLGNPVIVFDPWQASLLAAELRAQRYHVIEHAFTSQSRTRLFAHLLDLIRNNQLKSYEHAELERELYGLEVHTSGSGWRVDHAGGQFDDHAMATMLGIYGLLHVEAVDPAEMTAEERRNLGPFQHYLAGAREPFGGWGNVVHDYETQGPDVGWGLGPLGYCDGPLGDFNK